MLQPGGKLEASATYKYVAKTFWSCLPRYIQTFLFTEKEKCYTYVRWRHANIEHYLIKNQLLGFYLIFLLILIIEKTTEIYDKYILWWDEIIK